MTCMRKIHKTNRQISGMLDLEQDSLVRPYTGSGLTFKVSTHGIDQTSPSLIVKLSLFLTQSLHSALGEFSKGAEPIYNIY